MKEMLRLLKSEDRFLEEIFSGVVVDDVGKVLGALELRFLQQLLDLSFLFRVVALQLQSLCQLEVRFGPRAAQLRVGACFLRGQPSSLLLPGRTDFLLL